MNKLKDKLKELRAEKDISQKTLAKTLNLSEKTISHYENGYSEPSLNILVKLAQFFGVTTDYLLGLED